MASNSIFIAMTDEVADRLRERARRDGCSPAELVEATVMVGAEELGVRSVMVHLNHGETSYAGKG